MIKDREENSMSTTYEIYKFAKPTLKELSIVDYYSDYDVFSIFNVIKNIDLYAVSQGMDGILKILDIVSQFSVKEPKTTKQWFDD